MVISLIEDNTLKPISRQSLDERGDGPGALRGSIALRVCRTVRIDRRDFERRADLAHNWIPVGQLHVECNEGHWVSFRLD